MKDTLGLLTFSDLCRARDIENQERQIKKRAKQKRKEIMSHESAIRMRKWRKNNPEKAKAANKRALQKALEHPEKGKERMRLWRKKNPEKAEQVNQRARKKHKLKMQTDLNYKKVQQRKINRYYRLHPEKRFRPNKKQKTQYSKNYREKYPEKERAHHLAKLKVPITSGCSKCGATTNLQRHHPDYSKPLEVIILCRACHVKEHWGEIPNE